jgi:hypothetical protein
MSIPLAEDGILFKDEFLERKIGHPEIFSENLQLGDLLFAEKNKGECFGY